MVIGGPILTVGLLRTPRKAALLALLGVFVAGQTLGALAPSYWVMLLGRVITALAASAFFGLAAAACVDLVGPSARARALSIVFGGMMLAQVVGLPAATLIEQSLGWRASSWIVDFLAALCVPAVLALVPSGSSSGSVDIRSELRAFRDARLWGAYATNALIIGSVFAAFSYFSPIFTEISGFSAGTVPLLFAVYGVGTVLGNIVTGRLADRHTTSVLAVGLVLLAVTLGLFAVLAGSASATVAAIVVLGLVGMPMNPAMGTRVMRLPNDRALVSTVNTAAINVGIVIGPLLAGVGISADWGYRSPLWAGALLAVVGLLSLLPFLGGWQRKTTAVTGVVTAPTTCAGVER